MSFAEFRGIWQVREATTGEDLGHRIAIGGRPNAVRIICIDAEIAHRFDDGTYQPHPERIEVIQGGAAFEITLIRGVINAITCRPRLGGSGGGPGSWTAEDNVGDEQGRGGRR